LAGSFEGNVRLSDLTSAFVSIAFAEDDCDTTESTGIETDRWWFAWRVSAVRGTLRAESVSADVAEDTAATAESACGGTPAAGSRGAFVLGAGFGLSEAFGRVFDRLASSIAAADKRAAGLAGSFGSGIYSVNR